jgi:hypothetical protein
MKYLTWFGCAVIGGLGIIVWYALFRLPKGYL